MKKFITRVLLLALICSLLIGVYCKVAEFAVKKYNGPTTADQIHMSFDHAVSDDYNCYFLGNSRIYRNINPDCFPSVHAYNFGHDNDSYNQMYYKLLYLMEHRKPIEYLIIGTDYFQFSFLDVSRNYIYSNLFPEEYQLDFENKSKADIMVDYCKAVWSNKQNAVLPCLKLILNRPAGKNVSYQKDNGQYFTFGTADPDEVIDRDYSVLDIQLDYFRKIIAACEANEIQLYVIMPPLWSGETKSHTDEERKVFDDMIRSELSGTAFAGNYINYSEENGLLPYTDFTDITHLNAEASDRFSEYINEKIFGD